MEVFNVSPGSDPDLGDFRNEDYDFSLCYGSTVIIMYTTYLIVKQASPRLKPHMICHLVFYPKPSYTYGVIDGIDYGPVVGTQEQYTRWLGISGVRDYGEQVDDWQRMLTQEGKTDEEILHDAWRGRGNMWVFVRPDRFVLVTSQAR